MQSIYGSYHETIIGKTDFDLFAEKHARQAFNDEQAIIRTGEAIVAKLEKETFEDGHFNWVSTTKVPLRDEGGQCTGLVGISLDVTEQKLNERTLKSTIQTLEETKLQLIEAEKLKTVGRLAAGIAHEVKNPLNVVSLGAEYLANHITEPEELLQVVRDMREAVQKADHVIFELLDYSSPHKVSMQPANINDLITRILSLMRHNFNEVGITVVNLLSDDIEPVRMDGPKMEQVLINLFLNAISVMKKGGFLTVRTDTMRMKSAGSNVSSAMTELFRIGDSIVVVEVLDTGTGLTREDEHKAFDPFYSTKATGEGTGLGLSVTRSIAEMHHGMITLKNRKDSEGASVRLLFPAANPNTDND